MSKRKKQKKKNIFRNKKKENYRFTTHFFNRWNERMKFPKFKEKRELEKYIKKEYPPNKAEHISEDYYLIGDIIVICTKEKSSNSILFVTVYGKIEDNKVLFNILNTKGARTALKFQKKYGKFILPKYKN